jgi:Leucine-rich repeat (LRR) protein
MKKLLLILLCLPLLTLAQQTYVPDDAFESFLEANGMGNGISNDDYVTTANINTVTYLDVNNKQISDLTGIENFTALTELYCLFNQLIILDVSQNTALTFLNCRDNQLTSLNVSGTTALDVLFCEDNYLTVLDVSNNTALTNLYCENNQLTSIDLNGATALTELWCEGNELTNLDVSQNTVLVDLHCQQNQLTILDLRNGNNWDMVVHLFQNPNLFCINVDDAAWSTANWTVANGKIDPQHYFSNNCSGTAIQEHSTNKELFKVTGLLGRETKQTNQPLFYIYDDGTVEKRIVIE